MVTRLESLNRFAGAACEPGRGENCMLREPMARVHGRESLGFACSNRCVERGRVSRLAVAAPRVHAKDALRKSDIDATECCGELSKAAITLGLV